MILLFSQKHMRRLFFSSPAFSTSDFFLRAVSLKYRHRLYPRRSRAPAPRCFWDSAFETRTSGRFVIIFQSSHDENVLQQVETDATVWDYRTISL